MMGYILAWIFPIYINIYNRDLVDSHRDTDVNVNPSRSAEKEVELERAQSKPISSTVEHADGGRDIVSRAMDNPVD